MLGSCLALGCSISSFAYRRQEGDRYQALIFGLAITAATIFGLVLKVNPNLIMLGLIPWALCCSMIFSTAFHWLLRRCSGKRRYVGCGSDEKKKKPLLG